MIHRTHLLAAGVALAALALLAVFKLPVLSPALVSAGEPGAFGFEAGERVVDFRYRDVDGRSGRLSTLLAANRAVVVVLRTTECPVSRRYGHRIAELEREYADRGVAFLYLTVSPQDTWEKVKDDRETYGFRSPYVRDPEGRIGGFFQARVSTEVFLVDAAGTLRYRGPVDDQYGIDFSKPEPGEHFLAAALDAVLDDRPVRRPSVQASGCHLGSMEGGVPERKITYHSRVGRILEANCVSCHREGGVAPFSLESYEQAYGFRHMIDFVVESGRMPPWFAHPDYGSWANDRSLSARDRRDLLAWIRSGAPRGNPAEGHRPAAYAAGWNLEREPDVVVRIPEPQQVPESGTLDYRYVFVKTDFEEDLWVRAMEPRPTAVEQVHHIIVYLQSPEDERRGPFFAGWAPGVGATIYPEGYAKRLPKGAWLMFELHYTPNGRAAEDWSMVGFLLADGAKVREVATSWVGTDDFEIPPHAENHRVEAVRTFERSGEILLFAPHMHVRGKAYRFDLIRADGSEETILEVPNYDFNWQMWYQPVVPLRVESGDRLRGIAWYDNSAGNPANPNPTVAVRYGKQSWDEMMFGFYDWAPEAASEPSGER